MNVRAKFRTNAVTDYGYRKEVQASPVVSQDKGSENAAFWRATPAGSLTLTIDNPAAAAFFKPGQEFYLTFEDAQEGA